MKNNRLLITLLSLVLIYAILGFVAIPKILKPKLENIINENINQTATIEKIEFNPFLLKASLKGLKIEDKGITTLSLDEATIDFAMLKSLDEKHINFKNFLLVNPYINIIQYEDESLNLQKILKQKDENSKEKPTEESSSIAFQFSKTVIKNAKIEFTKLIKNNKPYKLQVDKFNYTFYDMGTFRNNLASHSLHMIINKNTKLAIKGGLRLSPFEMYGNVNLTDLKPTELIGYKQDLLNFNLDKKATINLDFGYQVNTAKSLKIEVNHANLKINNIALDEKSGRLFSFESFSINNLDLKYPENQLNIEAISLNGVNTHIKKDKKENFNFNNLINSKELSNSNEETKTTTKPWNIDLNEFALTNSNLSFKDDSNSFNTELKNIALILKKLNIKGEDITLKELALKVKKTDLTDSSNNINVKNIDLNASENSFIDSVVLINKLSLNKPDLLLVDNKNNRKIDAKDIKVVINKLANSNGNTKIEKVEFLDPYLFLKDENNKTDILAKNIDVLVNKIEHKDNTLSIANSTVNKPYFAITLGKQNSKNVITEKKEEKAKNEEKSNNNFHFDVGPLKIKEMRMTFQDKNLPIPFRTNITKLNGEFSRLNSSSSKPTELSLEGEVDKYGYTKITGTLDVNDIKLLTDTNIIFKNIAIKNFTPYSGKFVGREIDSGKLNLNLKYNIKKSNLDAQNSVIISDIKLGKNVKSPDAVNLPLEFAIALLEDSNGVIDIDLPIKGNVDDPQFSVAPIVWKAFTNLIIKAVTAPFSLLASLFGVDEEKLKGIDFEYGKSDIIVSEKEALDTIAKILEKKPKLAINIEPIYNTINDKKALQNRKIELKIENEMKKVSKGDEYKIVLERLYNTLKEKKDIEELKKEFTKEDKDKKSYFDNEAYVAYLKDFLASKEEVTEDELVSLSKIRVEEIKNYLLNIKKIPKESLNFKEISTSNNEKEKWTQFKITLSTR
ncbi:DUF748 domain-containing protein [Halarcobacter ebronensis]|uniref:DUF748 domain-containing membrane protein n=1 Tax=Halarcobacter ebronensis TaxID=1462615 RepID=A0A4Q1AMI7_9BACT|nr:DUF748 domain-containing protein [Halarcobacter ebronensis]QKF81825.1 DUF748 domain-containing membrane protein [Halarcobacter ebronensis]RXK01576.1 hypothetical protein CRV07_14965 [Halarcobacter ebronensis]